MAIGSHPIKRNVVEVWAFGNWGNSAGDALVHSGSIDANRMTHLGITAISGYELSLIHNTTMEASSCLSMATMDSVIPSRSLATLLFLAGPVCVVEDGRVPADPSRATQVTVTADGQPVHGTPDKATAYSFDGEENTISIVVSESKKVLAKKEVVIGENDST